MKREGRRQWRDLCCGGLEPYIYIYINRKTFKCITCTIQPKTHVDAYMYINTVDHIQVHATTI